MSGWAVAVRGLGDTADVYPLDDLIPHQLDDDCVCGPAVEIEQRPGLTDVHRRRHHSLDGREHQKPEEKS